MGVEYWDPKSIESMKFLCDCIKVGKDIHDTWGKMASYTMRLYHINVAVPIIYICTVVSTEVIVFFKSVMVPHLLINTNNLFLAPYDYSIGHHC